MLKLTIKNPERRHWCRSGAFIVNFEHISQLVLVFLSLTMSRLMPAGLFYSSKVFVLGFRTQVGSWFMTRTKQKKQKNTKKNPKKLHL